MDAVNKEKTSFLWNELLEYEKNTEMTDEECILLHEWVAEGNSVHDNPSMLSTDQGIPSDFLDTYRYEEEIRKDLRKLSPREQENYLARLQGEDTVDNLREDLNNLFFKMQIYEQILCSYGLLDEAVCKMKKAKKVAAQHEREFKEWLAKKPEVELPFE